MANKNIEQWVVLIKTLRANGAVSGELGQVVMQALRDGVSLRSIARAIGVTHVALLKWLRTASSNPNNSHSRRGRPSELNPHHAQVLRKLASSPETSHLPALALWRQYLRIFECNEECQARDDCPHDTVSYHTALRFIKSLPAGYREQRSRMAKRFRARQGGAVAPALVWEFDRLKSDVLLVKNPATGETARFEIGVGIDRGTMTCLAIGAVEREAEGPKGKHFNPYFDAAVFNSIVADALCGALTGVPAKPKSLLIDWGKVENNAALLEVCKYLRIDIQRARPYDPGSKPEVEAFASFVHSQLEAYLPGYVGPFNQRPETRPLCTESGRARRQIDPQTGEVYWTDDAGRRLLTVFEFNQFLREWAMRWNAQVSPKWQRPRLEVFQQHATAHYEPPELLRIRLMPATIRKIRSDGEVEINKQRWWSPVLAIYAGFGDYRTVKVRVAPDMTAWATDVDYDDPIGGSLATARLAYVPAEYWTRDAPLMAAWGEFKREIVRRVKQIVAEARKEGIGVDEAVARYKDELLALFNVFQRNPHKWAPQPRDIEDVHEMTDEEFLALMGEAAAIAKAQLPPKRDDEWQWDWLDINPASGG